MNSPVLSKILLNAKQPKKGKGGGGGTHAQNQILKPHLSGVFVFLIRRLTKYLRQLKTTNYDPLSPLGKKTVFT